MSRGLLGGDAIASVAITVALVLLLPGNQWSLPVRLLAFAVIVTAVPAVVCLALAGIQRARTRASEPSAQSSASDLTTADAKDTEEGKRARG